MTERILIVEDDPDIVRVLEAYLQREGLTTEVAGDGESGLNAALASPPALIVLDWMLPQLDGEAFMRRLRPVQSTPVVMLTARGEEEDRLRGFALGVDDYLPKPFSPRELVARVLAVLRRAEGQQVLSEAFERGPLRVDVLRRSASVAGQAVELTTLEFNLLQTLATQPGRVWSRDELLDRVWGRDFAGVDRVVDVHVSNVRAKLEPLCALPLLLTVRGVGYKFTEGPTEKPSEETSEASG